MAARKRFGQHFLEPAWADKVVAAIHPASGEEFIEIGPGRGALTTSLTAAAGRVTAFEIDRDLAAALRASAPANLDVVDGDVLESDWRSRFPPNRPVRVAGNLPYNVASPVLFKLIREFDAGVPITDATLMLQREVVDRLLAQPSTKEYGVLTILVALSASVERLFNLPPGAFRPMPRVQSALVRLRLHAAAPCPRDRALLVRLVTSVFTRRRKTLENALRAFTPSDPDRIAAALRAADIDGRRRPETLGLVEFVRLGDALSALPGVPEAVL